MSSDDPLSKRIRQGAAAAMTLSSSPPPLETSRLLLTGHSRDDYDALAAMWADPEVVGHIGKPSSKQESWSRLLRYRGLWPLLGYGYWAVRDRRDGRYLGDVGFADFGRIAKPTISGVPEAGWIFRKAAHGHGYGSEAVAAILAWLDRTSPQKVICLVHDSNEASRRIAEKNNFQRAGDVDLAGEVVSLLVRDYSR